MKLDATMYHGKPPSLEEGPIQYEIRNERANSYNRGIQFLKVILYLELIVFIGWMGCIFLTNYYQGHRYTNENGPNKVPELKQYQVSGSPWTTGKDDIKAVIPKSESSMESVIDKVEGFIETDTTTTTSVIETDDKDINDTMLLSAWLHMMTGLGNSWDDDDSNHDFSSSRMVNSAEFPEDPSRATSTRDYLDTIHESNDDFSESATQPDVSWFSGDSDEVANSDEDAFSEGHFVNWHFDFRLPDLVAGYLSPQAITTIGEEKDSSSSSIEEMDSPALRDKRSIGSSSSEEKKSAPMVKRSTNNSSSESDSSDSSSSESSEITMEATKKENNCPKILDDNGHVIDDPKDIVNHIKRNWFNWILATPVPNCDKPQSAKTVTIDECGRFVIKCTPDNSDETNEVSKEYDVNHRHTRNVVKDDEVKRNECEQLSHVMQNQFDRWITNLIAGETSDPIISELRQDFKNAVEPLAAAASMQEFMGEQNTTAQQWLNLLTEIKQNISISKNADHRRVLEERVVPTQEMANGLRQIVESAVRNVSDCVDVLALSEKAGPDIMYLKLVMQRRRCMENWTRNEAMENALAAELVAGESSDSIVMDIRGKFKALIRSLAKVIIILELLDPGAVLSSNITEEAWKTIMLDLKQELVNVTEDPSHRQRLDPSVMPTQEQANQLRAIMNYHVHAAFQCEEMPNIDRANPGANIRWGRRLNRNFNVNRNKRYSRNQRAVVADPLPKSTAGPCSPDEDDVQLLQERQTRLKKWNKAVAADKPELRVPILDIIDAQLKAENISKIVLTDYSPKFSSVLVFANEFIGNSSSNLRREGYELARDLIIELQKLDSDDTMWKNNNTIKAMQNFTSCRVFHGVNFTPEDVFIAVIKVGEALNMRYTAHDREKPCGDSYQPVYGQLMYNGEKPEKPSVRNWRHIFSAIIKLYFKIYDPQLLPNSRCNPSDVPSQTEPFTIEESKGVVKRSITYSNRKSDNTVDFDDQIFLTRDDIALIKRINLDLNTEPRILQISQEMFFDKMETLSSHIDRLHEIYQKYNELHDDYVSKEFPSDSSIDYEYE